MKFADDTTVIGLISNNNETAYREEIEHFATWCTENNQLLNTTKTKELIIDFRKDSTGTHDTIHINGIAVERVSSFKFLGTHISADMSWSTNTPCLVKKAHQRLFFLRTLRNNQLPSTILVNFYRCAIESILTNCVTVWHGSSSVAECLWTRTSSIKECNNSAYSINDHYGYNVAVQTFISKPSLLLDIMLSVVIHKLQVFLFLSYFLSTLHSEDTFVKTIGKEPDLTPICTNQTSNIIIMIACKIRTERSGGEECRLLYRDGGDFVHQCDSRFTLKTWNDTVFLHLTNLTPADSGIYTCECAKSHGTYIVHLNVTVKDPRQEDNSANDTCSQFEELISRIALTSAVLLFLMIPCIFRFSLTRYW
ncbi:uncharacterized protein LOC119792325 [Cyprinodon tularosa]|uniref:uncharacterized protein LOC119792325 n=1 Tax=Cyprinodon tularosa TaxID=77115 RepID=UPI0018E200DD|nr:uncharacterized protein LOC119792325 [Cyprinodon tularosa]